jgi:hypothetical protein
VRRHHRITFGASLDLRLVGRSVDLDDESRRVTVDVPDKPPDHLLSAEVQSVQSVGTEVLPQGAFLVGHLAAMLSGESEYWKGSMRTWLNARARSATLLPKGSTWE